MTTLKPALALVLPVDAGQALVKAASTEPEKPPGMSVNRSRALQATIDKLKRLYPDSFKQEQ